MIGCEGRRAAPAPLNGLPPVAVTPLVAAGSLPSACPALVDTSRRLAPAALALSVAPESRRRRQAPQPVRLRPRCRRGVRPAGRAAVRRSPRDHLRELLTCGPGLRSPPAARSGALGACEGIRPALPRAGSGHPCSYVSSSVTTVWSRLAGGQRSGNANQHRPSTRRTAARRSRLQAFGWPRLGRASLVRWACRRVRPQTPLAGVPPATDVFLS